MGYRNAVRYRNDKIRVSAASIIKVPVDDRITTRTYGRREGGEGDGFVGIEE